MLAKRQRTSALSAAQLFLTVQSLELLVAKARKNVEANNEGRQRAVDATGSTILDQDERELLELEKGLSFLKAKLYEVPQSSSSSELSLAAEHLRRISVVNAGFIDLKADAVSRGRERASVGADKVWSSESLYQQICFLERTVPRKNEAAARLWVDSFFFRVACMLPESQSMVLDVRPAGAIDTLKSDFSAPRLAGYVDWTAVWTHSAAAARFTRQPFFRNLDNDASVFHVSEAKGPDQILDNHVAKAIGEMYACARTAGKSILRGGLTNGHAWIFLILTVNQDGSGGYLQSQEITIRSLDHVSEDAICLIPAIITHWILHSHKKLDVEDYFNVE